MSHARETLRFQRCWPKYITKFPAKKILRGALHPPDNAGRMMHKVRRDRIIGFNWDTGCWMIIIILLNYDINFTLARLDNIMDEMRASNGEYPKPKQRKLVKAVRDKLNSESIGGHFDSTQTEWMTKAWYCKKTKKTQTNSFLNRSNRLGQREHNISYTWKRNILQQHLKTQTPEDWNVLSQWSHSPQKMKRLVRMNGRHAFCNISVYQRSDLQSSKLFLQHMYTFKNWNEKLNEETKSSDRHSR